MAYQNTEYDYGSAIQEICRMVGHPIPADAAGSVDAAVQQMGVAVNRALAELLTMFDWQDLTVKTTLNIVAGSLGEVETAFNLPTDFHKFIDQSQWGGNSQFPALGPMSNQAWMMYAIRGSSPQLTLAWQMRGDQLYVLGAPYPVGVPFEYMYMSKAMVIDADTPTTTKNVATKNGDSFVIDDTLVMLLGRAKYLEWKGFDSSAAIRDFLIAYNSRVGANKGAPILNIGAATGAPLLNPMTNVPDTGYGS